MESSDTRRQSDVLPSIQPCYSDFERARREGMQFQQRHPSINRASISGATPISPTTMFGPPPGPPLPSHPHSAHSGIHTPPESRRTSDNDDPHRQPQDGQQRQSLPSLHDLFDNKPSSFSAPSPMHTPPIGSGSFSALSQTTPMPRSQPSEVGLNSQPPPPAHTPSHVPTHGYGPAGPSSNHAHESYTRHGSQGNGRTLPPNPYSQAQPPPAIPAMHPPDTYVPRPSSVSSSTGHPHPQPSATSSPHYPAHSQYAPPPPAAGDRSQPPSPRYGRRPSSPTRYSGPPPPAFPNAPPPPQYGTPYGASQPQQQPPPPPAQSYAPHPPHPPYPYPPRDSGYPPAHGAHPPPISKGMKRGGAYGSAIERALSLSAIRRDLDTIKEHSSRIYHLVNKYQESTLTNQAPRPGELEAALEVFSEAISRSSTNTETLQSCQQVFRDLTAKEYAEQNQQKLSIGGQGSEYGADDATSYGDDTRSIGSQQPEQKKVRRGRAAPPGRCHSCQRAETPEWRRGPDGARTLCNACGLHYAKLTRKLSKNGIGNGPAPPRKPPSSPLP